MLPQLPRFLPATLLLAAALPLAAYAQRVGHPRGPAGPANRGVVSTLAGTGSGGSANGVGTAASFNSPTGVAVDAAGTVYVADCYNQLIRQITPAGVVTTLAGSGSQGSTNGPGSAATFRTPYGVAVGADGLVYVADFGNNLVRRITPAGVVSTLAGSGQAGRANGRGSAASFYHPSGVAVDAAGTVYVADRGNNLLRRITAAGVVTTLAGGSNVNGLGTAARFNDPTGVAVDAAGTVYVADRGNQLIRRIAAAGMVSTLAGSGGSGSTNSVGTTASFNNPTSIAVNAAGTLYVGEAGSQLIRVIK